MGKRTQGSIRVTLDLEYDVGTLGDEAEVNNFCATSYLDLQSSGRLDEPVSKQTIRNCAATLVDVLIKNHNQAVEGQPVIKFLNARLSLGSQE